MDSEQIMARKLAYASLLEREGLVEEAEKIFQEILRFLEDFSLSGQ